MLYLQTYNKKDDFLSTSHIPPEMRTTWFNNPEGQGPNTISVRLPVLIVRMSVFESPNGAKSIILNFKMKFFNVDRWNMTESHFS